MINKRQDALCTQYLCFIGYSKLAPKNRKVWPSDKHSTMLYQKLVIDREKILEQESTLIELQGIFMIPYLFGLDERQYLD